MDEKITITNDECERATPLPPPNPSPTMFDSYGSTTRDTYDSSNESRRIWPWAAGAFALIAFIILVVSSALIFGNENNSRVVQSARTVDDVRAKYLSSVNTELASPNSKFRKYIEDAHWTVTVTRAEVVNCEITTIDGSNRAGKNDNNISYVSMLIRFHWDGYIHKDGTTDLRIEYDGHGNVVKWKIENTDALVNADDPIFWLKAACLLGEVMSDLSD